MNNSTQTQTAPAPIAGQSKRRAFFQTCKFCGEKVNMTDEGVTYGDGTAAHEACHDGNEFDLANAGDFRD